MTNSLAILLIGAGLLAGAPHAASALTAPSFGDGVTSAQPGLTLVARKGTRNYQTDDTALQAPGAASQADDAEPAGRVKECIDMWDAGTHMSVEQWRETCKRLLHDDQSKSGT
jgi:hypothetical protein